MNRLEWIGRALVAVFCFAAMSAGASAATVVVSTPTDLGAGTSANSTVVDLDTTGNVGWKVWQDSLTPAYTKSGINILDTLTYSDSSPIWTAANTAGPTFQTAQESGNLFGNLRESSANSAIGDTFTINLTSLSTSTMTVHFYGTVLRGTAVLTATDGAVSDNQSITSPSSDSAGSFYDIVIHWTPDTTGATLSLKLELTELPNGGLVGVSGIAAAAAVVPAPAALPAGLALFTLVTVRRRK